MESANTTTTTTTINRLPEETIAQILTHLSVRDKVNASLVCKKWHSACNDPLAWRHYAVPVSFAKVKALADNSHAGRIMIRRRIRNVLFTDSSRGDKAEKAMAWMCRIHGLTSMIVKFSQATRYQYQTKLVAVVRNGTELRIVCSHHVAGVGRRLDMEYQSSLVRLELHDSSPGEITDTALGLISHHLKSLAHLTLIECSAVTDVGIRLLSINLNEVPPPPMRHLKVVGSHLLTDRAMEHLSDGQPGLTVLCLTLTARMTDIGAFRLAAMASLQTWQMVYIWGTVDLSRLLRANCHHLCGVFGLIRRAKHEWLYFVNERSTILCHSCCCN